MELDALRGSTWRLSLTAHVRLLDRIEAKLAEAKLPPLEWYDVLLGLSRTHARSLSGSRVYDFKPFYRFSF